MRRRGKTPKGHSLWTDQERATVRRLYPDYTALQRALPHRTYYALRNAAQALGVVRRRHRWTASERAYLRRRYATADWSELLAAFPGLKRTTIRERATDFGFHRRRSFKITGQPVIDAIRERATILNYSMVDVDAMARTRRYFAQHRWLSAPRNYKAMAKAVQALHGRLELRVTWD